MNEEIIDEPEKITDYQESTNKGLRYAGLTDRVKALIFDSVFYVIFMFIATSVMSSLEGSENATLIRVSLFVGIFVFYEPIFISVFGGTLGQLMNQLRVKKQRDESKNINFFYAIVRFGVKVLLGIISLLTIFQNDKNQALHDKLVGSVVIRKQ